MKRFIAAACMLGWVLFPAAGWSQSTLTPVVKKSPVDMPQRVLFVGSSIMYYAGALQTHTHRLAAAATPPLILRDGFKSVHITTGALHHYPLEHYVTPGNLGGKEPFQLVVLGGNFTSLQPNGGAVTNRNRAARVNADGTVDSAFNPSANGTVRAVSVQQDGRVIVGGNERVLRARLSDAKFFWDQDRKVTLASRAGALKDIVFHAKLGTQFERV